MYRTEGMKLCLSQIRMYKRMLQSILKIGLPAGFEAIMYSISNIIVQVSINNFGVDVYKRQSNGNAIHHDLYILNTDELFQTVRSEPGIDSRRAVQ